MNRAAQYLTSCPTCGGRTTRKHVRDFGTCKACRAPEAPAAGDRTARIIDAGWGAYATEEGHYDTGGDR